MHSFLWNPSPEQTLESLIAAEISHLRARSFHRPLVFGLSIMNGFSEQSFPKRCQPLVSRNLDWNHHVFILRKLYYRLWPLEQLNVQSLGLTVQIVNFFSRVTTQIRNVYQHGGNKILSCLCTQMMLMQPTLQRWHRENRSDVFFYAYWTFRIHMVFWIYCWNQTNRNNLSHELDRLMAEYFKVARPKPFIMETVLVVILQICTSAPHLTTRLFTHLETAYEDGGGDWSEFRHVSELACLHLEDTRQHVYKERVWEYFEALVESCPSVAKTCSIVQQSISLCRTMNLAPSQGYIWLVYEYMKGTRFRFELDKNELNSWGKSSPGLVALFLIVLEMHTRHVHPISFCAYPVIQQYRDTSSDQHYRAVESALNGLCSRFRCWIPSGPSSNLSDQERLTIDSLANLFLFFSCLVRLLVSSETLLDTILFTMNSMTTAFLADQMESVRLDCQFLLSKYLIQLIQNQLDLQAPAFLVQKTLKVLFVQFNLQKEAFLENEMERDRPVLPSLFQKHLGYRTESELEELRTKYWMNERDRQNCVQQQARREHIMKCILESLLEIYGPTPFLVVVDESWIQCLDPRLAPHPVRIQVLSTLSKMVEHGTFDRDSAQFLQDRIYTRYIHELIRISFKQPDQSSLREQWNLVFRLLVYVARIVVDHQIKDWMFYFAAYGVESEYFRPGSIFEDCKISYRFVYSFLLHSHCETLDHQIKDQVVRLWMMMVMEKDAPILHEVSSLVLRQIFGMCTKIDNTMIFGTHQQQLLYIDLVAPHLESLYSEAQLVPRIHGMLQHGYSILDSIQNERIHYRNVVQILVKHIPRIFCVGAEERSQLPPDHLSNEWLPFDLLLEALARTDSPAAQISSSIHTILNSIYRESGKTLNVHMRRLASVLLRSGASLTRLVTEHMKTFQQEFGALEPTLVLCKHWLEATMIPGQTGQFRAQWPFLYTVLASAISQIQTADTTPTLYEECFQFMARLLPQLNRLEDQPLVDKWIGYFCSQSLEILRQEHSPAQRFHIFVFWRNLAKYKGKIEEFAGSSEVGLMYQKGFSAFDPRNYYNLRCA